MAKAKAKPAAKIQEWIADRMQSEIRYIEPQKLEPHPRNPRLHSDAQRQAMSAMFAELGNVDVIRVCPHWTKKKRDAGIFVILDGHMRTDLQSGRDAVPCLVLDLNRKEADKFVALFDAVGSMAEYDSKTMSQLMDDIQIGDDSLAQMMADITANAAAMDLDLPVSDYQPTIEGDGPAAIPPPPEVEEPDDAVTYGGATAMIRGSVPMRIWRSNRLLAGKVLDFGSGTDTHQHAKFDPFHNDDRAQLTKTWDTVTCNYVLNTQPADHLVVQIVALLARLVKPTGRVLIAVRNDVPEGRTRSDRGFQVGRSIAQWEALFAPFLSAELVESGKFYGWKCRPFTAPAVKA